MIFSFFTVFIKVSTKIMKKIKKDVRINVKLTRSERKEFKEHCKKTGYGISKRLRELIEKDVKNGI